ncbi:MAG: hypothetical protein LBU66_08210 [Treponema sp.]|jgi:hypothetical protein|nr:hypothetical protein [Treponema sp.]
MKNKLMVFGIALVAVLGFSFVACDEGNGNGSTGDIVPSELQGTWIWNRPAGYHGGGRESVFHKKVAIFSASSMKMLETNDSGNSKPEETFQITSVKKGATTSGVTVYTSTVTGVGSVTTTYNSNNNSLVFSTEADRTYVKYTGASIPATWTGEYVGGDGEDEFVTISTNGLSWENNFYDIPKNGNKSGSLTYVNVRGGGDIKVEDTVVGEYVYLYHGNQKIGLLCYASDGENEITGIGIGNQQVYGVVEIINFIEAEDGEFDPVLVLDDITDLIGWAGVIE